MKMCDGGFGGNGVVVEGRPCQAVNSMSVVDDLDVKECDTILEMRSMSMGKR